MDDGSKSALEAWQKVVDGSSSVIAWFDTDTRRYIVIGPRDPTRQDGQCLNEQERCVASYAALGEANKVIALRLGVSGTRVSALLCSTLRKLGLRSKAQLVYWVRGLGLPISKSPTSEVQQRAA